MTCLAQDVPMWTDIMSAVSTAVGVIAAIAAGTFAALAYRREVQRDIDRDNERRSAQGSLVAAWGITRRDLVYAAHGEDPPDRGVTVTCVNRSDLPIYDVVIDTLHVTSGRGYTSIFLHTVLPGDSGERQLPHGMLRSMAEWADELDKKFPALPFAENKVETVVTFRDAANVTWYRDTFGVLHEGQPAWRNFASVENDE